MAVLQDAIMSFIARNHADNDMHAIQENETREVTVGDVLASLLMPGMQRPQDCSSGTMPYTDSTPEGQSSSPDYAARRSKEFASPPTYDFS